VTWTIITKKTQKKSFRGTECTFHRDDDNAIHIVLIPKYMVYIPGNVYVTTTIIILVSASPSAPQDPCYWTRVWFHGFAERVFSTDIIIIWRYSVEQCYTRRIEWYNWEMFVRLSVKPGTQWYTRLWYRMHCDRETVD